MACAKKEEKKEDIQDVKDADAIAYLQRHNLPTKDLKKQIINRKATEQK
jgi:hypothetical protein